MFSYILRRLRLEISILSKSRIRALSVETRQVAIWIWLVPLCEGCFLPSCLILLHDPTV